MAALALSACSDTSTGPVQDLAQAVDKEGAVELSLQTIHLDSARDVMAAHYKIWAKGNLIKEFTKYDTLPRLGKSMTEYADENGDTKVADMDLDYEFYVTVK